MNNRQPNAVVILGVMLLLKFYSLEAYAQTNQANNAGLPLTIEATGKAASDAMPASSTAEPIRPFDPVGTLVLVGGGEVTTEIRKLISNKLANQKAVWLL
jgi:hypothetical protein